MIDPADPFESALELLEWAKSDADKLDKLIVDYFAGKPDQQFERRDRRTGLVTYGAKIVRPLPAESRRYISDCVSHLRHSLDQALYAAIKVIGKEPSNKVLFPWGENLKDLEGRFPNCFVPEELHPVIRKIEPYPAADGYAGGDTMFRELARIAGPNKHRFAITVGLVVVSATEVDYQGNQPVFIGVDHQGGGTNEVILLKRFPGAPFRFNTRVNYVIGFDHIKGLRTSGVRETVKHFVKKTEWAIEELRSASATIAKGLA